MYRPKFCAECGAKVVRLRWRPWTSRRFCDACAPRFLRTQLIQFASASGLAGHRDRQRCAANAAAFTVAEESTRIVTDNGRSSRRREQSELSTASRRCGLHVRRSYKERYSLHASRTRTCSLLAAQGNACDARTGKALDQRLALYYFETEEPCRFRLRRLGMMLRLLSES
jgi:hypothetical protein